MGIKFFLSILILMIGFTNMQSQNLANNPSLEEYKKVPKKISQIEKALYWSSPNKGTPDFFTKKSSKINPRIGVPKNGGFQDAQNGEAYVGVFAQLGMGDGGEYIQTALITPMQAGKLYCCSFYISLSEVSKAGSKAMGMYFSNEIIKSKNIGALPFTPQIETKDSKILSDKENWQRVCGIYKATGEEKTIVIGNFLQEYNKMRMGEGA